MFNKISFLIDLGSEYLEDFIVFLLEGFVCIVVFMCIVWLGFVLGEKVYCWVVVLLWCFLGSVVGVGFGVCWEL